VRKRRRRGKPVPDQRPEPPRLNAERLANDLAERKHAQVAGYVFLRLDRSIVTVTCTRCKESESAELEDPSGRRRISSFASDHRHPRPVFRDN
jgi:hypothetical protein